jgi:hypothetical protein
MEGIFSIKGPNWTDLPASASAEVYIGPILQIVTTGIIFVIMIVQAVYLGTTVITPWHANGAGGRNYDALQGSRRSLQEYCQTVGLDPNTAPMVSLNVATANFGSIFTETQSLVNPWTGSVHCDAVRRQVEGGARAVILDIWPDPADSAHPVVCAMLDHREWSVQQWWRNNGLAKGTSNYSNWNLLTRNKLPAGEVLTAAINAAFSSSPGRQNTDPFFLIVNLHGAMTLTYLNTLGNIIQQSIQGYGMAVEWSHAQQQPKFYNAPISSFMNRVCVIVIPDIDINLNSLPGINTYAAFVPAFMSTKMGEVTNAIQNQPREIAFDVGSIGTISTPTKPNCPAGGPLKTPAEAGFCVVQPTIGGSTNDNATAFAGSSWTNCLQSGAQFVGVNMFSSDAVMEQFFDPAYFGTWSFKKRA